MTTIAGESRVLAVLANVGNGARPKMLQTMKVISTDMESYVQRYKLSGNPIHRQTGTLSRSMHNRAEDRGGELVAIVGTNEDYAKSLEFGAPPHVISPRNAMALFFTIGGKKVFAKSVNHPGNRAFHFMRDTLRENKGKNMARIRKSMRELVQGA